MLMRSRATSMVLALALGGCATTGTHPHNMSAADHDRVANREEHVAEGHEAQFDPDTWSTGGGGCSSYCFDTWSNPTQEHASEAQRHRALAAKHRKASLALRDAEEESCVGIPERDRDVSPFFHVDDITSVEQVSADDESATYVVSFSEVAGVDAEGMQKLLDCHSARNAALGHQVPEMDYCPLVLRGVNATAEAGEGGLRVRLKIRGAPSVAETHQRLGRLEARLPDP